MLMMVGGFVKDQDSGLMGQGNALELTTRKSCSPFAQYCFII
jgi:hypothetical protein